MDIPTLTYNEQGLIPCIVQDVHSKEVLMMAWMNEESLERTLAQKSLWFWSRSRQELWHKGESSGNIQHLVELRYDCDEDALLALVHPDGPACHTGAVSCFYRNLSPFVDAEIDMEGDKGTRSDAVSSALSHPDYRSGIGADGVASLAECFSWPVDEHLRDGYSGDATSGDAPARCPGRQEGADQPDAAVQESIAVPEAAEQAAPSPMPPSAGDQDDTKDLEHDGSFFVVLSSWWRELKASYQAAFRSFCTQWFSAEAGGHESVLGRHGRRQEEARSLRPFASVGSWSRSYQVWVVAGIVLVLGVALLRAGLSPYLPDRYIPPAIPVFESLPLPAGSESEVSMALREQSQSLLENAFNEDDLVIYRNPDGSLATAFSPVSVDPVTDDVSDELARLEGMDVGPGTSVLLGVPMANQFSTDGGGRSLVTGCEVTSLSMLLRHRGIEATKEQVADRTPVVAFIDEATGAFGDPNEGFVGDMEAYDPSGGYTGYSIYHGPIAALAQSFVDEANATQPDGAGYDVVDLTGQSFDELLRELVDGNPVWVVTTTDFANTGQARFVRGRTGPMLVNWHVHSVVLTGFDDEFVYLNDPYRQEPNNPVARAAFIDSWLQMGSQAVVIKPRSS